MTAMATKFRRC